MVTSAAPPPEAVRGGVSKTLFVVTVVIVAIIAFLGGIGVSSVIFPQGPALQTVVVGTNTPFPPFEARNPTTQKLEGFDIDLVNEIGRRNGWNVVWRDFQDWDALLLAIEYEGVDIGASSITSSGSVGALRNASFDFSNSYYEADQAVMIKSGTTTVQCAAATCTPSELANHTVAVQRLTSSYWWVLGELVDTAMTPGSMVSAFGDLNSVITELINGNVEWVLVDKPIAERFTASNPQLVIEGTIETNELYAYAVTDGDPQNLIPKINSALAAMRTDGTFQRIQDKWIG
jgi:ABC-type amino acid transport substrate-binding protein